MEKKELKIEEIEVIKSNLEDPPVAGDKHNMKIVVEQGVEFEILINKNLLKYVDKYDVAIALLGLKKDLIKLIKGKDEIVVDVGNNKVMVGVFNEGFVVTNIVDNNRIFYV